MKSTFKLGLFERVLLFVGFLLVSGALIGGYVLVSSLHQRRSYTGDYTPPPKPLPMKPKPLANESGPAKLRAPFVLTPPGPSTQPAVVAIEAEPVPVKLPEIVAVQPTTRPGPRPYALPLISAKVLATAGDADSDLPYRYHVKIDPAELEVLRAMLAKAAEREGLQLDEFDHVAAEPKTDLPWWRPASLVDVNVLALSPKTDPTAKIWTALSNKTGDVFVYTVKPMDFTRREASGF